MVNVVITKLPIASFSYYQWLVLGLYELERQKKIRLHFRINPITYSALFIIKNKYVSAGLRRLVNKYHWNPSYNMVGYVEADNQRISFTYDSADSPYMIHDKLLEKADVYFKMQCPKVINQNGFDLSSEVIIPYLNSSMHKDKREPSEAIKSYWKKIKPAMVGPRRLAWFYNYKVMRKAYDNMLNAPVAEKKEGLIMSYFGDAKGPKPVIKSRPNFNQEWEIMGYYGDKISHPNEKRAIASDLLNELDSRNDGRVITDASGCRHEELVVPYSEFTHHVSKFQYNLNISGFRRSIPNRFIESFMVGTAIVTDELALKWYAPFGKSVVETIPMGYERMANVEWKKFENDMKSLPEVSYAEIKREYESKWSPIALATYVVSTVLAEKQLKL
jgi:YD repeat-containing protein